MRQKPAIPNDRIIRLRRRMNLSQEQFGDQFGLGREAVSAWETGRTPLSGPGRMLFLQFEKKAAESNKMLWDINKEPTAKPSACEAVA